MADRATEIATLRAMLATIVAAEGAPQPSLEDRRAGYEQIGLAQALPEGTQVEEIVIDGLACERLSAPGADQSRAVLYLHGGGYMIGSPKSHRHLAAALSASIGAPVLVPHYGLAPEHVFPRAVDDAVKAYRWLLAQGVLPGRIAIGGDSAGGGLTLATAIALRDHGAPRPGALLALSPWADLTQSGDSYGSKAASDPIVSKQGLDGMAQAYLAGSDPRQPLASPCFADLGGLPPLYILTGSEEVLLSDSITLAGRASDAKVEVRLDVIPDMIHVYPYFTGMLSDARTAIDDAGAWIRARTAG
jgi:epsilon-lactone hydrolase